MNLFAAIVGLVVYPVATASAQQPSEMEQRESWARSQAAQRAFERSQFDRAGFKPIAEATVEGREVRRLVLQDPYGMLPIPGVELERVDDGRVTLRLQYRGWSTDPVAIEPAAWDDLITQEAAVFTSPAFRADRAQSAPSQPPPPCHGWIARIAADYQRTASWAQCGGEVGPVSEYAVAIVELAVATKANCVFDRANPFWSLDRCFAPSESLDDPDLERTFSVLRKEYTAAPGSELLSQARQALNSPELQLGNDVWLSARAAVARYRANEDAQRERLQALQRLAYGATTASPADAAKMQQMIQAWSGRLDSQERNYSYLLESLVNARRGPAAD